MQKALLDDCADQSPTLQGRQSNNSFMLKNHPRRDQSYRTKAQQMVESNKMRHRLNNRHCAWEDTRVMPTRGSEGHLRTCGCDRCLLSPNC